MTTDLTAKVPLFSPDQYREIHEILRRPYYPFVDVSRELRSEGAERYEVGLLAGGIEAAEAFWNAAFGNAGWLRRPPQNMAFEALDADDVESRQFYTAVDSLVVSESPDHDGRYRYCEWCDTAESLYRALRTAFVLQRTYPKTLVAFCAAEPVAWAVVERMIAAEEENPNRALLVGKERRPLRRSNVRVFSTGVQERLVNSTTEPDHYKRQIGRYLSELLGYLLSAVQQPLDYCNGLMTDPWDRVRFKTVDGNTVMVPLTLPTETKRALFGSIVGSRVIPPTDYQVLAQTANQLLGAEWRCKSHFGGGNGLESAWFRKIIGRLQDGNGSVRIADFIAVYRHAARLHGEVDKPLTSDCMKAAIQVVLANVTARTLRALPNGHMLATALAAIKFDGKQRQQGRLHIELLDVLLAAGINAQGALRVLDNLVRLGFLLASGDVKDYDRYRYLPAPIYLNLFDPDPCAFSSDVPTSPPSVEKPKEPARPVAVPVDPLEGVTADMVPAGMFQPAVDVPADFKVPQTIVLGPDAETKSSTITIENITINNKSDRPVTISGRYIKPGSYTGVISKPVVFQPEIEFIDPPTATAYTAPYTVPAVGSEFSVTPPEANALTYELNTNDYETTDVDLIYNNDTFRLNVSITLKNAGDGKLIQVPGLSPDVKIMVLNQFVYRRVDDGVLPVQGALLYRDGVVDKKRSLAKATAARDWVFPPSPVEASALLDELDEAKSKTGTFKITYQDGSEQDVSRDYYATRDGAFIRVPFVDSAQSLMRIETEYRLVGSDWLPRDVYYRVDTKRKIVKNRNDQTDTPITKAGDLVYVNADGRLQNFSMSGRYDPTVRAVGIVGDPGAADKTTIKQMADVLLEYQKNQPPLATTLKVLASSILNRYNEESKILDTLSDRMGNSLPKVDKTLRETILKPAAAEITKQQNNLEEFSKMMQLADQGIISKNDLIGAMEIMDPDDDEVDGLDALDLAVTDYYANKVNGPYRDVPKETRNLAEEAARTMAEIRESFGNPPFAPDVLSRAALGYARQIERIGAIENVEERDKSINELFLRIKEITTALNMTKEEAEQFERRLGMEVSKPAKKSRKPKIKK